VNPERFKLFSDAYRAGLVEAVTASAAKPGHADRYAYEPVFAPQVAERMIATIGSQGLKTVNIDGGGFRRACKALGIKQTYKAITAYLEGAS
jgi:hypothetical protein